MPHCIILLIVFHLNLNFKFKFKCISFSLSFSNWARPTFPFSFSYFLFPLRPSPGRLFLPLPHEPVGSAHFLSLSTQPSLRPSFFSPFRASPRGPQLAPAHSPPRGLLPSLSPVLSLVNGSHLPGPSPSPHPTRTRVRVRPAYGAIPRRAGPWARMPRRLATPI
jgi:hypothetical protein